MGIRRESPDVSDLDKLAVFRIADTASFLWESMDDAHIIYDTRSGHSQALNDFAREIFAILEDQPSSLADILHELELLLESPPDDALKQQVHKTILEFDNMGLIEPVSSKIADKK